MRRKTNLLLYLLVVIFLVGCKQVDAIREGSGISVAYISPIKPVGSPEIRNLDPVIETIRNCSGITETITSYPTKIVASSNGVEWATGGMIGVGVKIGEGVIPAGVDLSAALEGKLASEVQVSIQSGARWGLPGPPNKIMHYKILWKEIWQKGTVDLLYSDDSVLVVDVWYRSGITSEIIDEYYNECNQETIADEISPTPIIIQPEQRSEIIVSGSDPWEHNINKIPVIGTSIVWELHENQVFILTGGRFSYGKSYCGDDQDQICVLFIESDEDQTITVSNLITSNNWLGITSSFSSEEALVDIQDWFWKKPNCGNGCRKATLVYYKNDTFVNQQVIYAP